MQLLQMILDQGGPAADEVIRLAADEAVALGSQRDQVRQALAAKQESNENFLAPAAVLQELVIRGNHTATLDHVRTTMKRMADAGELLQPRPQHLLYALPSVVNDPKAMKILSLAMGEEP